MTDDDRNEHPDAFDSALEQGFQDTVSTAVQRLIEIHGDEAAVFAAMHADAAREAYIDDPAYDFWMQVKRIIDAYQALDDDPQHQEPVFDFGA